MAEAVHYHERITTRQEVDSTTFATTLTLTAAELATAGFSANNDVLILAWVMHHANNTADHVTWRVTYNDVDLSTVTPRYDYGTLRNQRTSLVMFRIDLGAIITDVDLDLARALGTEAAHIEKAEILAIRLADFGVENRDWFWDESTVAQTHSTTFVATNQASITFNPASVEDWVVVGCTETTINATNRNHEYRINMDSGTILGAGGGGPTEEGENTSEEKVWSMFDYINSLAASEHTIENEIRDDATSTNATARSALFVFRAAVWNDLFVHEAGTVAAVAQNTDTQVATITDTLSTSQDIVMLGHGFPSSIVQNQFGYMWVRQDGSTVIDPVVDGASGLENHRGYDLSSQPMTSVLAFLSAQSGTLDLDLFFRHNGGHSPDFLKSTFLVWGMELARAVLAVDNKVAFTKLEPSEPNPL